MQKARIILPILAGLALIFVLAALYFPLPLATNSDFRVLYYTNKAWISGIDLYDHAAKTGFVAQQEGVEPGEVLAFPQFAYPPWLALTTFYLGFMSIHSAATLWFEINIAMLFLSIWLLTDGWTPIKRLLAFPAAFLFIPVLGTLVVGQYDLPAVLGAALTIYAMRKQNPHLTALGLWLLTFKPHLGGLIILACLLHLLLRRDLFSRRTLAWTFSVALTSLVIGFVGDSSWPVDYFNSLLGYRDLSHITTCSECANISIYLVRWVTGELNLSLALRAGILILVCLLLMLSLIRPPLWRNPPLLLSATLLATLAASPYLYNYDYIMLLIPILWLAGQKIKPRDLVVLGVAALLPLFGLLFYQRDGNIAFIITLLLVAGLVWDVSRRNHPDSSVTI